MNLADLCGRYLRVATVLVSSFVCALLIVNLFDDQITRQINGPPIELLSMTPVVTEGRRGDMITFDLVGRRSRVCPAQIFSYWRRSDDPEHAFYRSVSVGGFSPITDRLESRINLPIPDSAPNGTITYDWLHESVCEDGVWIFSSRQIVGDLSITVLPD